MFAQLNHLQTLTPVVCERATALQKDQNSPPVLLRIRCFGSSRLTHYPKVSLTASTQSPNSSLTNRVSRLARNEAQDALFDYLHSTRSFCFTDAEYISKNSPHFIQNLLSKIDTEKDVAHSLTKFLRYNPINEFEPFFESLGLSPSELPFLLPRHLMFLRDDQVLLDNFHVLCDYGIPRSKIGKMYKEAREIFGYDFGVMSSKLQAYENLGLSKPTVIKLVSSCPLLLIGGLNCELVEVLQKLKALGIGNDWIRGYVTGDSMYNWGRMLDTMNFLEKVGYSEEKMCSLFKANPALLFEGSGKRVYILFGRLLKLGLKTNEVYCLFKQNPQILSSKYSRNLLQAVDFLLEIGMWIEDIADIVINHTEFLGSCTLKRPRSVCKDLKVEKDGLCEIIKEDPLKLLRLASKSKNKISEKVPCTDLSKHREKTSFLLRLGYIENSDEMTKALKLFRGRGDQLQERFDSLVQAGLDYNIVINIVRQAPTVLNQSKDVIEKKIDCLKNCLGYPLESVVAFPAYLCYDLGRINLRFSMYAWLRERGVAKPTLSLSTLLACSDARFVRYFVDVHPEGPVMWESLKNQLI
ncbi:hypothetical protein FEM48_Zijuj12G0155700 [Ziziphus jujuba var. spinosa]|uniref:Transcription termination factor MTEF18, mitochondrial-like n=1 Tax=Ziziphus jujuba var. spinosa TaxID=714518 RepID=A0A978UE62_ZIZJJ|nr:hypothetical protein FEM48_Zijuj12G0155700 [Ziziphus jujuba var. spinosa]